jgi:hypothetical protein
MPHTEAPRFLKSIVIARAPAESEVQRSLQPRAKHKSISQDTPEIPISALQVLPPSLYTHRHATYIDFIGSLRAFQAT